MKKENKNVEKLGILQLHYYLAENLHSMDAKTYNKVETEFLKIVQKKIGLEIKDIPTMNLKEVEELNVKCKFLMGIFSEMEEI